MLKIINTLIFFTLVLFAFFAGVKYSESVKEHSSWLFEVKEEEADPLDITIEESREIGATIDETIDSEDDFSRNYQDYEDQIDPQSPVDSETTE